MRDMVRSSRYLGTIEGVRKLRPVAALAALFFLLGLTILLSGCGEDTPTAEPTATATATHTPCAYTYADTDDRANVHRDAPSPSPTATQTPQDDAPQAPDFSLPTGSGDTVTRWICCTRDMTPSCWSSIAASFEASASSNWSSCRATTPNL